uniref:Reverse transcriptase domain-containing protein n=1 Tax=Cannabis sativa TaxID=3483 RepID=A0A803Q9A7_CANSA
MIGFECLNLIKRHKRGKKGFVAIKADMAKAYDKVEWGFIEGTMKRLGFLELWVNLVHISLRVEGLSAIIKNDCHLGRLHGLPCGRWGPMVSQLLFVDDSFFFLKASKESCARFREIMGCYERASGQLLNLSKSSVCFSSGVSRGMKDNLAALLGVQCLPCHEKHLGLPCFVGHSDGRNVNIKSHVWIPKRSDALTYSFGGHHVITMVSDFIHENGEWKGVLGWASEYTKNFQVANAKKSRSVACLVLPIPCSIVPPWVPLDSSQLKQNADARV